VETSAELERRLGLVEGWVEQRLGVRQRRLASPHQATSDLAVEAGENALRHCPEIREQHGLLILATSTPDHPLPPTAPLVAHRLGLTGWGAFDLAGACGGFIYALALAGSFPGPVMVVAANVLSRRVNPLDPGTSALFADGAGAIMLKPSKSNAILGSYLGSNGERYDSIQVPAGGSRLLLNADLLAEGKQFMQMARGPEVFRAAVHAMADSGRPALEKAKVKAAEIDWWIPHQANARLIAEVGKRLEISVTRTVSILADWGNSSAASIPTALSIAANDGRLQRGQKVLLTAAGAGMVEAGVVIEWS
jgi:3-oxoacyl-[acyl-carrier-protein] synthase-3